MEETKKQPQAKYPRTRKRTFEKRKPAKKMYEEKIIAINRVTKVVKSGRTFKFSVIVVIGNKKGLVGLGMGKANEIPDAREKAIQAATKNLTKISLYDNRTIPHEIIGTQGAAKVLLKPAAKGTGIIAGGAVRDVLEMAGITDILSKSLGSKTQINVAKATMNALLKCNTADHIANLRDKSIKEVLN